MLLYNKILIHEKVYIFVADVCVDILSCGVKGTTYSETDFNGEGVFGALPQMSVRMYSIESTLKRGIF